MKKLLQLFIISFLFIGIAAAQSYKQVKIYLNEPSDIQLLFNAGMEFDHPEFAKDGSIIVFVNEDDYSILKASGFSYQVLIDDWFEYYNNLPPLSESEKQQFILQSQMNFDVTGFGFGTMGGFYTFDEAIAELDTMFLLFPNLITEKVSIGTSIEGRPIYMVKISDNPNSNETEPQILYTALHHAREPESMMQMIFYMYYLLENYNSSAGVKYLVDNREMYFIPVLNPDGYEYNRQTNPNGGGMWRKNRRNNGGGSYGVDLNRNYGPYFYWNYPNGGSSTDPWSDTYRGTAPFSEPETAAIRDFLATKNFRNALNYHTYGSLLIYPYGALGHETADSVIFREFASDMTTFNGYTYGTDLQTVGYSTRGNSDDYHYDGDTVLNSGHIFAMTPEVGTSSDGFWPSQSRIFPLAEENVLPNLYYAWAAGEFIVLENPNYNQPYFNPGDNVVMTPTFRNKGLASAYNININLNSLSGYVTINNGTASFDSVSARSSVQVSSPLTFSISQSAPAEEVVKLEVTISSNAVVMRKDTVEFIIGTPTFIFVDTTNDPLNLWTITATPSNPRWEATTATYYSQPNSYTDSRVGNYVNQATVTMTLTNSIDLSEYTNPRLVFWTKFDIESNWDYGQVDISTNNGINWIPLEGAYTEPGVGSFQPNGEPVYDGLQSSWVKEEISLASYATDQVKVRFQLNTDFSVTRDGWYVDDIGIIIYEIVPVELTSFTAQTLNDKVALKWVTASELNNRGFEIQRAENNAQKQWNTIGFVDGSGTTAELSSYSFIDEKPLPGTSYYRLKQIDYDGSFKIYNTIKVELSTVTDYDLEQNYPNPFNPSTKISYAITRAGHVNLTVYNLLGSEVVVLVNENQEAGWHTVEFNTEKLENKLGSGIYLYTLKSGSFVQTRKMIMLK